MIFEIPPAIDEASFVQETALDGTTYRLTFRWNRREGAWYLTVASLEDVVIAAPRKLVPGAFLLRHVVEGGPPGRLLVVGTPVEDDLGVGGVLIYMDVDEIS